MEDFLEGVGVHFVDFTIEKGYGEMLHTLGRNFHAFLDNLDYLHWYDNYVSSAETVYGLFRSGTLLPSPFLKRGQIWHPEIFQLPVTNCVV